MRVNIIYGWDDGVLVHVGTVMGNLAGMNSLGCMTYSYIAN